MNYEVNALLVHIFIIINDNCLKCENKNSSFILYHYYSTAHELVKDATQVFFVSLLTNVCQLRYSESVCVGINQLIVYKLTSAE